MGVASLVNLVGLVPFVVGLKSLAAVLLVSSRTSQLVAYLAPALLSGWWIHSGSADRLGSHFTLLEWRDSVGSPSPLHIINHIKQPIANNLINIYFSFGG